MNRRKFLSKTAASALVVGSFSTALANTEKSAFSVQQSDVKITDVKVYRFHKGSDKAVFVKIETDEGTAGWGECSPNFSPVIEELVHVTLKPLLIGKDPFATEPLWEEMLFVNHDLGPGGSLTYAIAGVDCALWDLKGKLLNVPVYQLLGGKFRDKVLAYGGFGVSGGKVPVENAVQRAVKLAEKGFKVIKLRMQIRENNLNPEPDPVIPYYKAVKKALGDDVELFVDPNEGYTAYRAIQIGRELQDEYGMRYFEAPCPEEAHRETRQVVDALDIPVLSGEKAYNRWQFRDLILNGNPDMLNPDISKAGGISEGMKIASLCNVFHKQIVPHNTKPTLATAATLHVMAAVPNAGPFVEYIERDLFPTIISVFDEDVYFEDGYLHLPEAPGLGLTINEKRLEKAFNS